MDRGRDQTASIARESKTRCQIEAKAYSAAHVLQRLVHDAGPRRRSQLRKIRHPTGNLDTASSDEIFELMRRFNREFDTTFLVVTHDPRIADRCNRVIEIVDGLVKSDRVRSADELVGVADILRMRASGAQRLLKEFRNRFVWLNVWDSTALFAPASTGRGVIKTSELRT